MTLYRFIGYYYDPIWTKRYNKRFLDWSIEFKRNIVEIEINDNQII